MPCIPVPTLPAPTLPAGITLSQPRIPIPPILGGIPCCQLPTLPPFVPLNIIPPGVTAAIQTVTAVPAAVLAEMMVAMNDLQNAILTYIDSIPLECPRNP
jgi:hypothetical protein